MLMKLLGVVHSFGQKKDSDSTFDFCSALVVQDITPVSRGKYNEAGYGQKVESYPMSQEAFDSCSSVAFPATVEVSIEPQPDNLKRSWIVSLSPTK